MVPCTSDSINNIAIMKCTVTVEPPNNGHVGTFQLSLVERLSSSRRSIYTQNVQMMHFVCPLSEVVLISECPLSEVPLYFLLHSHTSLKKLQLVGCAE